MTRCGHSYCYSCISAHLQHSDDCPTCQAGLSTDAIYPNYSLDSLISKHVADQAVQRKRSHQVEESIDFNLLHTFLDATLKEKQDAMDALAVEIGRINGDLTDVKKQKQDGHTTEPALKKSKIGGSGGLEVGPCLIANPQLEVHMKDLITNYLSSAALKTDAKTDNKVSMPLEKLSKTLSTCAKYSTFKVLANMQYADSFFSSASSIISSIEFDMNDEYFCTAGI
jgi:Zinc finger, C3HC4 type (RING finger)